MSPVVLSKSPADIVAEYLAENLGAVSRPVEQMAWPLFVNCLWDINENVCTLFDTTPIQEGRAMRTGERFKHYGVQLAVRAFDYETGWTKLTALARELSEAHNETITVDGGQYELGDAMKLNEAFVGVDDKRRNLFTSNFILTMRKLS